MDKSILNEYNQYRNSEDPIVCYAPRKNLYFDIHGYVYSCCYNRWKPIGEYPRMTLNEIWHGELAKELRKDIDNFEFNKWCSICENDLKNKNFEAFKGKYYSNTISKVNKNFPTHMEFELTNKCNLECIMCNGDWSHLIRKNREKLPPLKMVYDEKFTEQLEEFIPNLQHALFIGGEPFVINVYYSIWEKIIELNPTCVITIQTNGSILNERIKKLLNKGNFCINVSLDSLNEKTYNKIRVNADFKKVYSNMEYFMEYCKKQKTDIGITPTIIQENYLELKDFVEFANNKNIALTFHKSFDNHSLKHFTKSKLKQIYKEMSTYEFSKDTWIERDNRDTALAVINQIKVWSNE